MKGFCNNCNSFLTLENSNPSTIRKGGSRCRLCRRLRDKERKKEITQYSINYRNKNKEKLVKYDLDRSHSLKGRFTRVKYLLKNELIPKSDLLWNFNFYSAFIRDAQCHYCSSSLNSTGSGLDRIKNDVGHTCYNVVPCCRKCNRIKGHDTSYEEMLLLMPALKEIVRLKSLT